MADAVVNQIALYAVVSEEPPIAGGAIINQIAIYSISMEYEIPISYIPFSAGQFMQTMPYYIGE